MLQAFLNLESIYPRLVSHEIIGKSWQGRDILLFKIGNPNGGRVWFNGCTHGGEVVGPEVYNLYAHWLLENKEPGITDRILQRNYTLILPMLNIDGYPATPPIPGQREGLRINRNPSGGVNLNRNFPKSWRTDCTILGTPDPATGLCPTGQEKIGRDPVWYCYKSGCACSWTDKPGDWEYRGSQAGSEPETKALLNALTRWKPKFFLDYHIWASPVIAKPSWRSGITTTDKTYHDTIIQKIKDLATQRGVQAYPSGGSLGICGGAADDGYATGGATSYLIEGLPVPPTGYDTLSPYSDVTDIAYPKFLPIAITFSQENEVITPPISGNIIPILAFAALGLYFIMKKK